ncbi:unnamed protein product [Brassicogethes aeneus]|uniref:Rab proteins geranylgeranyltransferase component A n=1 Tax=Brassicogethes aeneus TaxID=1431903 RepID=A0A9P0FMB8_BRAAE|nr:unnamed protein product [Brassicogethes aeneus]
MHFEIMDYELPTNFDVVVVGTGIIESIISAAASRIGKTVLHVDSNNFYGGLSSSFNLESFLKLNIEKRKSICMEHSSLNDTETFFPINNSDFTLDEVTHQWNITNKNKNYSDEENSAQEDIIAKEICAKKWLKDDLLKESRKFNIDLTPKVQYARGDFIELLISSNIARYSEYRSITRVLTWFNNTLEVVPCSRSDIFANNKISIIEKRILMKFFTSLDDNEDLIIKDYASKTYKCFLTDKKLSKNLIHYILYAISNSTDSTLCLEGIGNTKKFLKSLGRFGKTPFLYSMFGSGDLPQEFCRLSAVFGSVFALDQPIHGLILEENSFKSILIGKQKIKAKNFVLGLNLTPDFFLNKVKKKFISRGVFITNKSIMDSDNEPLTLLLYPAENDKNPCTVLELPWLSSCCPKDTYLVHISCNQINNPEDDLKHCVKNLFTLNEDFKAFKPLIFYSSYFSIPTNSDENVNLHDFNNLFICPGPDSELDFVTAVSKAKELFLKMYPDDEFLPRAPDPEEIKWDGDEEPSDIAQ